MEQPFLYIFSSRCVAEFRESGTLPSTQCFTYTVSRLLSLLIIVGAAVVKVPQVVRILKARSCNGVSLPSVAVESLMNIFNVMYGLNFGVAFSLYGENVVLGLQNILLLALFLRYDYRSEHLPFIGVVLACALLLPFPQLTPAFLFDNSLLLNMACITLSRGLQIALILRNKGTGELVFLPFCLNVCGNLARLLTVLRESEDRMLLLSLTLPFILNLIVVFLFIKYWPRSHSKQN